MRALTRSWQSWAIQALFIVVVLATWDYVGQRALTSPIFLPPLRLVIAKLFAIVQTSAMYEHLTVTLFELAVAFGIAACAGLVLGYFIGRSAYATLVLEPLIAALFAIPIVIFLPVFLLYFGLGMESKIAFGAAYGFFPIVLNTIGGIAQVDPNYVRVAQSMGASDAQMFRRVLVPAALPVIVTGLRIGCILCFLAIIGGEMIASLQGLGSAIVRLGEAMNTAEMFAYILFVILLASLLNLGLSALQARFGGTSEEFVQ